MGQKLHVRKGDQVQVLAGEDRGKTGKVLEVFPRERRVIVDGVNVQRRHVRPTRTNPQGGMVDQPGPVPAARVMVVCPACNKPTRVRRARGAAGSGGRVCRRCGKAID